ncbi:MAG: nucleoside triphosphate pyrophosphohydrolase [Candidatus Moraniibacteriota bacterium]
MRYNKLVRDRIVEIIEAKGEKASWHSASDEEYCKKLKEKLLEEVNEFLEAENKEEMADVFEVITAWLALKGWAIEDIIALQKEKRDKRGGFDKRIILEES